MAESVKRQFLIPDNTVFYPGYANTAANATNQRIEKQNHE
jgi:hypothetical protein